MGKKPVVVIQLFIALIVLIVSVGAIVFTANQAYTSVTKLTELSKKEMKTAEEFQANIGNLLGTGILSLLLCMTCAFGLVFVLLSLFMMLDAIYKWPSVSGNINYHK